MSGREVRFPYTGRFAPSPTGDLHFGSLLAAIASFLEARSRHGTWLVRIEDIDPPREVAGSARRILSDLELLGMVSDRPVLFQSTRGPAHAAAIEALLARDLAYWCGCSRQDLPPGGVYPGTCSGGLPRGKRPRAIRVRVPPDPIRFTDRIQGEVECDLGAVCGDFVIRRADGLAAYQLVVVVDDAFQEISEIVRGADLLDSTGRQIHLQRCLNLPTPAYAHIPVALGADGSKLSKRLGSDPVNLRDGARAIREALRFLGLDPPRLDFSATWAWALEHWSLDRVPRVRGLPLRPALSP
jgi:glutamyl-Q tRNA(Asp) synthetase